MGPANHASRMTFTHHDIVFAIYQTLIFPQQRLNAATHDCTYVCMRTISERHVDQSVIRTLISYCSCVINSYVSDECKATACTRLISLLRWWDCSGSVIRGWGVGGLGGRMNQFVAKKSGFRLNLTDSIIIDLHSPATPTTPPPPTRLQVPPPPPPAVIAPSTHHPRSPLWRRSSLLLVQQTTLSKALHYLYKCIPKLF